MGLLDSLNYNGGSGGGLLDALFKMGLMPSDQAQYGQPPQQQYAQAAPQAMAQMQPNPAPMQAPQAAPQFSAPQQQPTLQPQQAAAPQDQGPGFFDRLNQGLQSIGSGGSIIGALTGNRTDPQSIANTNNNVTGRALIAKGIDPQTVQAAMGNTELLHALITHVYGPQTVQSLGEGYVADKNGKISRAYTPDTKDNFAVVQTGEDGLGRKTFVKMNKATGEQTPIGSQGDTNGGSLGDMTKSGPEYLATLPKQVQGTVQGMLDGTVQPPSSFAASKPYWQGMIAAAKNIDPSFDENNWNARRKMVTDMAASGNSSMGGILSNGKSAFKHLAEYTGSAADLGNTSHDFPLGGIAAKTQNYIGNTFGGSDTAAKIKAINDNLGHYGQESTKFYAGTGGGVEERMNALKEMNPTTTSSAEMAAYAEKEKSLMLDRMREKEAQIRDTMGEAYLQKHPVFTPELQRDISRIDSSISKLRGTTSPAAPTAQAPDRPAIEAEMRRRGLMK